jgi:glycosyltransferase involved in cell wall biosynthesis
MLPIYAKLWTRGVLRRWRPAPLLHVIALGHCHELIRRARQDGSFIIADVVSTHPEHRRQVMSEESLRWGLPDRYEKILSFERNVDSEIIDSDLILAPSRHVAATFESRFAEKHINVLPYAANISRFSPDTVSDVRATGPLRILTVGQIGLRKGHLYLLEAASRFPRNTFEITFVGATDPQVKPRLAQYSDLFRHISWISNEQLARWYRAQDLYILPSVEEGLAVSMCEAMGCGLPVACTPETGGSEIIEDGIDGFVLPSRSVEGVERFLAFALRMRPWLREVGLKAAAKARATVNWHHYAERLLQIYEAMVNNGQNGS